MQNNVVFTNNMITKKQAYQEQQHQHNKGKETFDCKPIQRILALGTDTRKLVPLYNMSVSKESEYILSKTNERYTVYKEYSYFK